MKRLYFFAMTALALCGQSAWAQSSVTLYGDLDIGVQYLTHAGPGGSNSIGMQSSNQQPTRWGFKGNEDLGGGYAAIFQLENSFNIGNGQFVVPDTEFNRIASVGLQGPFGAVTFGRQLSVMFDQTVLYDPTYLAQFSAMSSNMIPLATLDSNNSVKWRTPTYAGVSGEFMYSFGQQLPGNMSAGRYFAGALAYENQTFGARVVFEDTRGTVDSTSGLDESGLDDRRTSLAVKYGIGDALLFAGYTNVVGNLHLSPPGNIYYAGLSYQVDAALSLIAEGMHYQTRDNDGHPTWYITGAVYSLSKSTSLYAYGGYLENGGGSDFTLNTYDSTSPGGLDQLGVQIGINHAF
jgi:predicted porin